MKLKDNLGREIDYMRISITDRCNLHCRYCMPEVQDRLPHEEILRYEEILRICKAAIRLGIRKFKITGGEPLVRKGAADLIARLKMLPGTLERVNQYQCNQRQYQQTDHRTRLPSGT